MEHGDEDIRQGVDRRAVLNGAAALGATVALSGPALASGNTFDVIIVGGGTAGSVLASRLSEDPGRRVLLIEAGKAYVPDQYPDPIKLQSVIGGDPVHDWGYKSEVDFAGKVFSVPRGKVLGGSSAINAAVAMRAPAADFERWARSGLSNWSYEQALPFYKRSERTAYGDDAWHGRSGPWPIHQLQESEVSDMQRAFIASAQMSGLAHTPDFNSDKPFGVGPYPMNTRMGQRLNTGMTYLSHAVRGRPNLIIRSDTVLDTVDVHNGRAVGVRLAGGEYIGAGEIVLTAGAYGSPAILMRSGVGPADALRGIHIPVVANLPVGQRLQDHPFFFTIWAARPERLGLPVPPVGAILWTHSTQAGVDDGDLQVSAVHYGDPKMSPSGAIFMLAVALTRPQSIGSLTLRDRNPTSAPHIRFNLLSAKQDRLRMVEGVELARRIAAIGPLSDMIAAEIVPGSSIRGPAAIERSLATAIDIYHHASSTAPMGPDGDPHAVTDYQGRVRGIANLRIADASIFPDIPSVATNPSVVMIAERISDWIRKG